MKARHSTTFTAALLLGLVTVPLMAEGPTIPPTVTRVTPAGVVRGTTTTVVLQGRSLAGAEAVLFDGPGLTAEIQAVKDLPEDMAAKFSTAARVPQGRRQEATVRISVEAAVEPGLHWLLLRTPQGASNLAVLDVGALPETWEKEPNDDAGQAQHVALPSTLVGTLDHPGDVDSFVFHARAGDELVFQVVASVLGSALESVLVLRDASGRVVARAGDYSRRPDAVLAFRVPADGDFMLSLSDLGHRGGGNYFYRVNAGAVPYLTGVFPLGVRAGESTEVEVRGANLGDVRKVKVRAPSDGSGWRTVPLRVIASRGESLNRLELAVSEDPEVFESEPNDSPSTAQRVTVPVTINGRIDSGDKKSSPDEDYFRFAARAGERLTLEVAAARLGSPLDSVIEVLDAKGHEIPRATVRCLMETAQTLNDRDSLQSGVRLLSLTGLEPNDYLVWGDELVRIESVPDQPDEDVRLWSYRGERMAWLNTSPQAHANNTPVYKAQVLEPGKEPSPNGLPVFHLTMRNDDGGPGYGHDSRLDFVAPQDGEYLVRIKDVNGRQGGDFEYRLTIRPARPDFELAASPSSPNVPRGGNVPVTVTANRTLGYDGPIELEVRGLPRGVSARPGSIPGGQTSTLVILEAAWDAPPAQPPVTFEIVGKANVEGRELARVADAGPLPSVVSLLPPPDLAVAAEPNQIVLEPGGTASVTLRVQRREGYRERVPCNVLNLPPGVRVVNVGLNGVLVPENETSRTFSLIAEGWAPSVEQSIYVVATAESNSSTFHTSPPLQLKVLKKQLARASHPGAPARGER